MLVAGYLLRRLDQLGWRPNRALAVSAVLRGSYHLYQGLGGFAGNLIMGVIFGRIFQIVGMILLPIGFSYGMMHDDVKLEVRLLFIGVGFFVAGWLMARKPWIVPIPGTTPPSPLHRKRCAHPTLARPCTTVGGRLIGPAGIGVPAVGSVVVGVRG